MTILPRHTTLDVLRLNDDRDLEFGTLLADRYRIGPQLGKGGMGTVYLAEHVRVGRSVAVKVLGADWLGHPDVPRRFREEARAASAAGHPNIIEVFDAGELPDGRPYLVMEYLEGQELFTMIHEGRLGLDQACRIVRDVARALAAAHERGVIHRDLKAENVMVVERAGILQVKVLDFGIASLHNVDGRPSTMLGHVMGTPAYMAPEQAKGSRAHASVDIYALGVLLHESLTTEVPFETLGPQAMLLAKVNAPAPSIATVRSDLPAELVELVDACLALDPEQRPATAGEVADRLDRLLARSSTGLDQVEISTRVMLPVASPEAGPRTGLGRWLLPGAALLVVGLVGVGAYVLGRAQEGDPSAARGIEAGPPERGQAEPRTPHEPTPPVHERAGSSADPESTGPPADPQPAGTGAPPDPADPPASTDPEEPILAVDSRDLDRLPSVGHAPDSAPNSDLCWRTRKQAQQARTVHDWRGVIRHTQASKCWQGRHEERRRLRTKANMELGNWGACISSGQSSNDREVRQWVTVCRRRREQG